MKYFHFSLGPVQGFVAQARRTRDFWAGSFLLSWLSAVAMRAVQKQGGHLIFPQPDENYLAALESGKTNLKQGGTPNRFKAGVPHEGFDPEKVIGVVQHAWIELARLVYTKDFEICGNEKTKAIWDRQVNNFWEFSWALTAHQDDSSIIDRLKNWRVHLPPDEPGVKCMMMEGWQELSGTPKPDRKQLKTFWDAVRNNNKPGIQTDLRENEHLCAIAFIKRRFARYFKLFQTNIPDEGWQLKGWQLPSGVPSVHYMAAAPWLAALIEKANNDRDVARKMSAFHDAAYQLTGSYGEWESNIRCVVEAANAGQKPWIALDGTVFFDTMLENPNLWDEKQQTLAQKALITLKDVSDAAHLEPVSPFYALLLMDGDQLGIHLSDPDKQNIITTSLAQFTSAVSGIVESHSGFLIYAGGDDVLALLPLEEALPCAAALRSKYLQCFACGQIPTSLSGAIQYAHIKIPLGKVIGNAHNLLDIVAKEGRGRDAIACRVWKPGGLAAEWAMPWEHALESDGSVTLHRLAHEFQAAKTTSDNQDRFASKFFYKIREHFDLLNPEQRSYCQQDELQYLTGQLKPFLDSDQAISLMAAEYKNSGTARVKTLNEAREVIKPLLHQCRPVLREAGKQKDKWKQSTCLEADGALLVRFLAHKGVDR